MGSFRLIEKHLPFQKRQAFRCLLFIWEIWEAGKGMLQSRRVQAPFGAVGIGTGTGTGTGAVLSRIPEGSPPLTGVRVDGAAGPLALGAKGSVRDRLTPPGRAPGFRPREVYSIDPLGRYGAFSAIFYAAFGGENRTTGHSPVGKQANRPGGRRKFPLWWLAPPPSRPVGKRVT